MKDMINEICQNRTCLFFSNDKETLKSMDKIVVLEKGRTVKCGHYDQIFVDQNQINNFYA